MERIVIEASSHSPEIDFNVDGKLKMEGRSIPEDINKLFNPLIEFVSELEVGKVVFDVNLEYFNTATSKKLLELFKNIEKNEKIEQVLIKWHFEEGDEDSCEMAEIYAECLTRSKFEYLEYAEVTA
jgi:hypothetical protein